MKVKNLVNAISRYLSSDENIIVTSYDEDGNKINFHIDMVITHALDGKLTDPIEIIIGDQIHEGSTTSE